MTAAHVALLLGAGFVAGFANAIVGGGTMFTFPAFLAVGLPPVIANTTNPVAVWPASVTASAAYLPELKAAKQALKIRLMVAFVGGAMGAALLLISSNAFFFLLVPWLLALATALFAFNKPIVRAMRGLGHGHNESMLTLGFEFLVAVYGGYFGAGQGIMLMAGLALAGVTDVQHANAQKNLLASVINGIAVVIFVALGKVVWSAALVAMAGAIVGGTAGVKLARMIPETFLRALVLAVGCVLSAIYFYRVYF